MRRMLKPIAGSCCTARGELSLTKVFLSYRIAESAYVVKEISRRMAQRIGRDNVFRDDDSVQLGTPYSRKVLRALEQCDLLVAVIGPFWLEVADSEGNRYLDDDGDWVRLELRKAFEQGTPVIPVLLDDAELPPPDRLPADIRTLGHSQFWRIHHRTVDSDIEGLLDRLLPESRPAAEAAQPPRWPHATQINQADNGSTIAANNGGTQHITISGDQRGQR